MNSIISENAERNDIEEKDPYSQYVCPIKGRRYRTSEEMLQRLSPVILHIVASLYVEYGRGSFQLSAIDTMLETMRATSVVKKPFTVQRIIETRVVCREWGGGMRLLPGRKYTIPHKLTRYAITYLHTGTLPTDAGEQDKLLSPDDFMNLM